MDRTFGGVNVSLLVKDNECKQNLPQDSEEAATAASSVLLLIIWQDQEFMKGNERRRGVEEKLVINCECERMDKELILLNA